ncbi:hypothetical protein NHQ30_007468 [Ciborinia camelliae]|nr:hypothetical protein NHQ30_007468 [Ciborinia camelliae]
MSTSKVSQTEDLEALFNILHDELDKYLQSLRATGQSPPSLRANSPSQKTDANGMGEISKREITQACNKIAALVHSPFERIFIDTAGYVFSAISSVAVRLKLHHLMSENRDFPTSLDELAKATGASEELIWRVLRILTQKFVFEEIAPKKYVHNAASKTLQIPGVEAWVGLSTDDILRASAYLLPMLEENNFKIPESDGKCAFSKAFNIEMNQFEYYFSSDPERGSRAAISMSAFNSTTMFTELPYPLEKLSPGAIIIDVGGGSGHFSATVAKTHQFIVQDTGDSLTIGQSIEEYNSLPLTWQEAGLFDPQPVLGAEVYMIRADFDCGYIGTGMVR